MSLMDTQLTLAEIITTTTTTATATRFATNLCPFWPPAAGAALLSIRRVVPTKRCVLMQLRIEML